MPDLKPETWSKVTAVLTGQFAPSMKEPDGLSRLLENFKNSHDGARLALCLAIDLMAEAFSSGAIQAIVSVLNEIDCTVTDARIEFGRRVDDKRHEFSCASQLSVPGDDDDYLTIVSLDKFIDCAGASFGYTDDPEDRRLLRKRYGSAPRLISLRGYGEWWQYESRIVWVTRATGFVEKWSKVKATDRASEIKDALGLPTPPYVLAGHALEYLAFHYPPKFKHPSYQPTSLDAWWRDSGWYLSYRKEDGWGRTRSISGKHPAEKERVHKAFQFESITSEYRIWYLGIAAECAEDKQGVIDAGGALVDDLYREYSARKASVAKS